MINEVWLPVKGFEGYYEVSNTGKIKSIQRMANRNTHIVKERILKPGIHKYGYLKYSLSKGGKIYYVHIHRVLAIAFLPNPNNYPVIHHIDGNPANNTLENLEWCTFSRNTIAAYDMGRINKHGSSNHMSKLTKEQAIEIFLSTENKRMLSKRMHISISTVNDIKAGRRWKDTIYPSIAPGERKHLPDVLRQEVL